MLEKNTQFLLETREYSLQTCIGRENLYISDVSKPGLCNKLQMLWFYVYAGCSAWCLLRRTTNVTVGIRLTDFHRANLINGDVIGDVGNMTENSFSQEGTSSQYQTVNLKISMQLFLFVACKNFVCMYVGKRKTYHLEEI